MPISNGGNGGGGGGGGGAPYLEPSITGFSPLAAEPGDGDTEITVDGECFYDGETVLKAGATALATTVLSQRQLTAVITAALLEDVGTLSLTAENPAPGGASNAVDFEVYSFAPTLTSATPSSGEWFGPDQTVTVLGDNFTPASVVKFGGLTSIDGTPIATTYIDEQHLSFVMPEHAHFPPENGVDAHALTVWTGDATSAETVPYALTAPAWLETMTIPDDARLVKSGTTITRFTDPASSKHYNSAAAQCSTWMATDAPNGKPLARFNGTTNTAIATGINLTVPFERVAYIRPLTWVNAKFYFCGQGGGFRGVIYQGGETGGISLANGGFPAMRMLPVNEWALVRAGFGTSQKASLNNDYNLSLSPGGSAIVNGDAIGSQGGGSAFASFDLAFSLLAKSAIPDAAMARIKKFCDRRFLGQNDNSVTSIVVCHGDSMTQSGSGAEGYPSQLGRRLQTARRPVYNRGVVGLPTSGMITNFAAQVASLYDPSKRFIYVIMGGTNDINGGASAASVQANLVTLRGMARALGPNVRVANILEPPFQINPDTEATYLAKFAVLQDLWTLQRADAANWDFLADLAALGDPYMNITDCTNTLIYVDKVHRTALGYSLLATEISAGIAALCA